MFVTKVQNHLKIQTDKYIESFFCPVCGVELKVFTVKSSAKIADSPCRHILFAYWDLFGHAFVCVQPKYKEKALELNYQAESIWEDETKTQQKDLDVPVLFYKNLANKNTVLWRLISTQAPSMEKCYKFSVALRWDE